MTVKKARPKDVRGTNDTKKRIKYEEGALVNGSAIACTTSESY